jgi:hypothetical protein
MTSPIASDFPANSEVRVTLGQMKNSVEEDKAATERDRSLANVFSYLLSVVIVCSLCTVFGFLAYALNFVSASPSAAQGVQVLRSACLFSMWGVVLSLLAFSILLSCLALLKYYTRDIAELDLAMDKLKELNVKDEEGVTREMIISLF